MNDGDQAKQSGSDADTGAGASICPICGESASRENGAFPFCSPRCRLIDLGNWLDEAYVVTRPLEQRDLEEGD